MDPTTIALWMPVITGFINNVGFPIVVAGYLLFILYPQMKKIVDGLASLAVPLGNLANQELSRASTENQVLVITQKVAEQNAQIIALLMAGQGHPTVNVNPAPGPAPGPGGMA